MHVIGHHHPIIKHILLLVEMPERCRHHICNLRFSQMTCPHALVKKAFHLALKAALALATALISEGIYLSSQLGREVTIDEVRERSVSTAFTDV